MESIILFGTGKYFKHKEDILDKYSVKFLLDNKIEQCTEEINEYRGILMINPLNLEPDSKEKIYLMTMNFIPMWKQLVELGICPNRLVYPFFEKPYFQSDSVVDEFVEKIKFGNEHYYIFEKNGKKITLTTQEDWFTYLRALYRRKYSLINEIASMDNVPISEQFATERGKPIDRVYIEQFLFKYKKYIRGDVLEIEDSFYTRKYGGEKVEKSIVIDVGSADPSVDFNANIETGEGICDSVADCFILTQTLMYIYDLEAAAHNITRFLKIGGIALITCSCLSQNSRRCMDNYGSYFNFNAAVFNKMFQNEKATIVDVGSYGNVKTALAHLAGMCAEDLQANDFEMDDRYYPLIVYAVVRRDE